MSKSILALFAGLALVMVPATGSAKKKKKKKPVAEAPVATTGTLSIDSSAKGAKIEINGKVMGALPLPGPLTLPVGTHTVKVTLRGYTQFNETVTIKPGEEEELEVDLFPVAGIVKITSEPSGATVKVKGKVLGVTPFDQDVTVGKVEVVVESAGFKPHKELLDILPGKTYPLTVKLEAIKGVGGPKTGPEFYETWWFWTVIGVAVAGGAAATAVVLTSDSGTPPPTADFTLTIP